MTSSEIRSKLRACRLIAIDLDGTFLSWTSGISARSRAVVHAMAARSALIVPTTGRDLRTARDDILQAPELRYFITANGALVEDAFTGERLAAHLMEREGAARLVERFEGPDTAFYVQQDDGGTGFWGCADLDAAQDISRGKMDGSAAVRAGYRADVAGAVRAGTEGVPKVGILFRAPWTTEKIAAVVAAEFPGLVLYETDVRNVEVSAQGADKGAALALLCAHLGIAMEDVCAIGDNGNDIGMLSEAGLGVAMRNAAPAVVAAADVVTEHDNEHEGAARFFQEYLLS